jgi:hypothetical protein
LQALDDGSCVLFCKECLDVAATAPIDDMAGELGTGD